MARRTTPTDGISFACFLPDLPARLKTARLSVSQAGYNTVADILSAGCHAVLVPYASGGETEQTQRAGLMQARRLACVVMEEGLGGPALARGMDKALDLPTKMAAIDLEGARRTAEILAAALAGFRS